MFTEIQHLFQYSGTPYILQFLLTIKGGSNKKRKIKLLNNKYKLNKKKLYVKILAIRDKFRELLMNIWNMAGK